MPLPSVLQGAPEGLPLRAGRTGSAVGAAWLPAGGTWGLQGVRYAGRHQNDRYS
jgi:hypothetical protein